MVFKNNGKTCFSKRDELGGMENPTIFGEKQKYHPHDIMTCKGSHRCARVEKKTSAVTTRERRGAGSWPPNILRSEAGWIL